MLRGTGDISTCTTRNKAPLCRVLASHPSACLLGKVVLKITPKGRAVLEKKTGSHFVNT